MDEQSEIARLRAQLSRGFLAFREALHGPRMAAQHQIIAHAYDALGKTRQALIFLVGEEHAIAFCYTSYNHAMKQREDGVKKSIEGIDLSMSLQSAPMQEPQKL